MRGLAALVGLALAGCQAQVGSTDARPPGVCGDGVVDTARGEVCDDGVNDFLGGGCKPGCVAEDRTHEIFSAELLEISIEIAARDWEALRIQRKTRHGIFGTADCRNAPIPNPYTYFSADITIDGERITGAGLRKKGHLGSQSTRKPSLKLKLDEYVPGQSYKTATRLALNNAKSDPAYARTCLAYQVFAAAGIPAPRCTYAHVTVNGEDLGVYVATEEVKKDYLRRHFADAEGNLYEGTACDFRPEFIGGFEQETNETTDPGRADLLAVYDVVQNAADSELESRLDAVIDLDAFYRFWATESLVWHRDGYSGNANNYFVYADPGDGGRLRFLPWGPDSAFRVDTRANVPDSVLAFGSIAYRLYLHPPARARFYTELDSLLADVWDPNALAAEVDRVLAVIGPRLPASEQGSAEAAAAELQTVIAERRAVIESVAAGQPEWTAGMRGIPCWTAIAPISVGFATTWDTLAAGPFTAGTASLTLTLDGSVVQATQTGARAGLAPAGVEQLQVFIDTSNGRRFVFTLNFPDPKYFDPFGVVGTHDLVAPPATMLVVIRDISVSPSVVLRRFEVGEGQLTFDAFGTGAGAAINGSFQGTLFERI